MEQNTNLEDFFNQLFESEEEKEEASQFQFKSDLDIDDDIESVKNIDNDEERLKELYKAKIDKIKMELDSKTQKLENKKSWILFNLKEYFSSQKGTMKETKTMFSKDFLSGKIVIKKPTQKLIKPELDEKEIEKRFEDYKKEKVELDWAELKKDLTIINGKVINKETGKDLSDVISIEEVGETIQVK